MALALQTSMLSTFFRCGALAGSSGAKTPRPLHYFLYPAPTLNTIFPTHTNPTTTTKQTKHLERHTQHISSSILFSASQPSTNPPEHLGRSLLSLWLCHSSAGSANR